MSYMMALYRTYERLEKDPANFTQRGLLKVGFSTQQAHVDVKLDKEGNFISATPVEKQLADTVIPVTEYSANRTSKQCPHPLFDKLKYIAGDYPRFCKEDNAEAYQAYMEQLQAWCESSYSNPKVKAVYQYLNQKTLIHDLVEQGVFSVDENGRLTKKWENQPNLKLPVGNQSDAFVRFSVIGIDSVPALWQDGKLQDQYTNYYLSQEGSKKFCYVTGNHVRACTIHPSKIRNSGDKAKLISANDTTNFTYRGRFETAEQAYTISYEASQKAHNALKWLIQNQKQVARIGDRVFVLWGVDGEELPDPMADTFQFCFEEQSVEINTEQEFAQQFKMAITGYHAEIRKDSQLVLLGLDAATTGRMAVVFNREYNGLQGNELIDNIERWHKTCAWNIRYYNEIKKQEYHFGAPSPVNLAKAAFGVSRGNYLEVGSNKLLADTVQRILPCICDGAKIPRDIVKAAVNKAKFPQNYGYGSLWEQVAFAACALYNRYLYDYDKDNPLIYRMEEFVMGENGVFNCVKETDDIEYNCGRFVALADAIENQVLWGKNKPDDNESYKEVRPTNARRLLTRFCQSPYDTLTVLYNKVNVYIMQSKGIKLCDLCDLLDEMVSRIDTKELKKKRNLGAAFLSGFCSQRIQIIKERQIKKSQKMEEE